MACAVKIHVHVCLRYKTESVKIRAANVYIHEMSMTATPYLEQQAIFCRCQQHKAKRSGDGMYNMLVRRLLSPDYHRVTFTSHPTRLPAAQRSFGSVLQMHLVSPGLNNGTANRRLNRVAEGHEAGRRPRLWEAEIP